MHPLCLILSAALWTSQLVVGVAADSDASPDELVATALKLTTEYNSAVRPPPDNGNANTILVLVFLNSLVKVDSTAQEVTLQLWRAVDWTDRRLSWQGKFNSSLDNISGIYLPPSLLWLPDVTFFNILNVDDVAKAGAYLFVSSTGYVSKNDALTVTTKCKLQMQLFPFDKQICEVKLNSNQQFDGVVKLQMRRLSKDESSTAFLDSSNEFCIVDTSFEPRIVNGMDVLILKVAFQRISTFYVVNLMLPSLLLLAISALAFRLPPECGERVSFSITIVLSMCVFLQLAGNYTPTQSESVPLITWYFSAAVLMTLVNVVCNAFVLSCHYKQGGDARVSSRFIRALFLNRFIAGSIFQLRVAPADAIGAQPEHSQKQAASRFHDNEWDTVAASADKVFFAFFVVASCLMLAAPLGLHALSSNSKCLGV